MLFDGSVLQFDCTCFWYSGTTKENGELMTIQQEMRAASIIFGSLLRDENVQVNGMIFVFDMTGVGTKQMSRITSGDMRKWHSCWKEVSLYIKCIHAAVECRVMDIAYVIS